MAADTAAKRYSAIHLACPWRGLNVVPNVAIPQGERQAVMFLYSGILAGGAIPVSGRRLLPIMLMGR